MSALECLPSRHYPPPGTKGGRVSREALFLCKSKKISGAFGAVRVFPCVPRAMCLAGPPGGSDLSALECLPSRHRPPRVG